MFRRPYVLMGLALGLLPCSAAFADTATAFDSGKAVIGWANRDTLKALPIADRPRMDPTCPGAWLTPIPPKAKIGRPEDSTLDIEAENIQYSRDGVSTLQGHVRIQQPGRRIDADNAELTQEQGKGRFSGNILIAEPGLVLTGDKADFDFETREARIERTEFVSSAINAHGRADQIIRDASGHISIAEGEYSTCPPDDRTWSFIASDIRLNQATGRGEVRDATLRIKDVPILYFPYFNFPIDDRRQSGILIPRFGNTNDGGFDLAVPIYLNLAPNYDATLTPRLMTERGAMIESEFRYLLPYIGYGTLTAAILPNDNLYQDRDRKSVSWKQNGMLTPQLQLNTNVNYVSDSAYFIDLGTDLNLTSTTFQERTAELIHRHNNVTITGRVQGYQTIDPLIPDVDKPYSRLPQLLLEYARPSARGWETSLTSEAAYFERPIDDGSGLEVNGSRYRLDSAAAYHMVSPWGFITPKIGVRSLGYVLDGSGVTGEHEFALATPTASLDSGLIFEREYKGFLQTLEPRAFYLYTPYHDQSALPNFDTATTTFSYQQLFRDSRFSGSDRMDDANQFSLGLTSRILNHLSGEEVIRASIGQIFYFRDRKVQLDPTIPIATENNSGLAAELSAPIGRGWSGVGDALWSADREYLNQYSLNFNYLPESRDRLANIGYSFRRSIPSNGQQALRQANLSIVQPLGISWQMIGLLQYDTQKREIQEAIAGLQYESCCWKARVYHRQFLADPDNISPGAQRDRRAVFLEIELKGLAGLSSGIRNLLSNNMFGYSQLAAHSDQSSHFLRESP